MSTLTKDALLKRMSETRISIGMTPKEAFAFILRLSSDDEFRASLEKDPHRVLAEHRVLIPPRGVPIQVHLPGKEELQDTLADIMMGNPVALPALPFNVDPGFWFFIDFLIFLVAGRPGRGHKGRRRKPPR